MKVIAEDIIAELSEIGVLMARRENLVSGKTLLYYAHGVRYGEAVDLLCTGHGGSYATSLAKFLLKKDLDVVENDKRVAFTISWIAEDVDVTVDGDPDVIIVRDSIKSKNSSY